MPTRTRRKRRLAARHLKRNLPASAWREVEDPRGRRGRRYTLPSLLQVLMVGLVANAPTLRAVEHLVHDIVVRRELGIHGTPSDTRLADILPLLPVAPLLDVLQDQVRAMHRAKQLSVLPQIGLSLIAIDGKVIAKGDEKFHPEAQCQNPEEDRNYLLRVLRAVLVSSSVKPALGQVVVPADKGEANTLSVQLEQLLDAYGGLDLIDCFSLDAGFTSRENLEDLHARNLGFIAGLKGNQPTLYEKALRILGEGEQGPQGGWQLEVEQKRDGRRVTLFFARSRHALLLEEWPCIRQVWRVRQRVQQGEKVTFEDRFFVTNLPWGRLQPGQCLACVRAHWGIENESNWTLDAIWKEDSRCWSYKAQAIEVLSVLRLIAYNLIRLLRQRVFRSEQNRSLPYRRILELVRMALTTPDLEWAEGFS